MSKEIVNNATASATASFPFWSILTLILVIAKITGYVQFSWWLVFAPLFVPLAVVITVILAVIVGFVILAGIAAVAKRLSE
jgi:hypothetical protein